jgi:chromosome segregation ATPase
MIGTTVTATIAAVRASIDAVKAAVKMRDDRLVESILQEMNSKISSVQAAYMALQEKHAAMTDSERDLKSKLRELEDQASDFANYEKSWTEHGGLLYRDKSIAADAQHQLYLCANCMAAKVKTFLQPVDDGLFLHCNIHGRIRSNRPEDLSPPASGPSGHFFDGII